jgi:uncharacterized membrane protein
MDWVANQQAGRPADLGDMSTAALVSHAVRATEELAQAEVELAREEMQRQVRAVTRAVVWAAIAGISLTLAFAAALAVLAVQVNSVAVAMAGGAFLVLALLAAACAVRHRPRAPLWRTRQRLRNEASQLAGRGE